MSHGRTPSDPIHIGADDATEIADAFTVLANPSRVRILGRLCNGPGSVGQLGEAAGLSPSATSHQLRMMRHMGWVMRRRDGRQIIYSLHDPHIADLLAQALFHLEHVRSGDHDAAADGELPAVDAASSPA